MRLYRTVGAGTVLVAPELEFLGEIEDFLGVHDQSEGHVAMAEETNVYQISQDVKKVVEHLNKNQTTKGEAKELRDAADRSIRGHDLARGIGNLGERSDN